MNSVLFHLLNPIWPMALKLNNWFCIVFVLAAVSLLAQEDPTVRNNEREYKDGEQFEKFRRRRRTISAWQINQLREGALVVKLKTNNLVVNALEKNGDSKEAEVKRLEAAGINVNMMRAFRNYFNFCKLYFIYSQQGDSLLKGVRRGIFLDSSLQVDPAIEMTESYYMLAETDRLYNSTIGFVPEDSARIVIEKGTPTTQEPYIVIKNKYGHQLNKPFPYFSKIKAGLETAAAVTYIYVKGERIPFNVVVVNKRRNAITFNHNGDRIEVFIQKQYIYERLSLTVQNLDYELKAFYQSNPEPRVRDDMKPFLY